jgi:hypothetical protein
MSVSLERIRRQSSQRLDKTPPSLYHTASLPKKTSLRTFIARLHSPSSHCIHIHSTINSTHHSLPNTTAHNASYALTRPTDPHTTFLIPIPSLLTPSTSPLPRSTTSRPPYSPHLAHASNALTHPRQEPHPLRHFTSDTPAIVLNRGACARPLTTSLQRPRLLRVC